MPRYAIKAHLIKEDGQPEPNATELVLHDQNEGKLISKAAFIRFLRNYFASNPADTDFAAIRFNRQILELALAFKGCESMYFVRAKNQAGADTIMTVMADAADDPIGFLDDDNRSFVSVEWGRAFTAGEARAIFPLPSSPLTSSPPEAASGMATTLSNEAMDFDDEEKVFQFLKSIK